eukprot:6183787-Pleurochrysis_carterae.AAC.2
MAGGKLSRIVRLNKSRLCSLYLDPKIKNMPATSTVLFWTGSSPRWDRLGSFECHMNQCHMPIYSASGRFSSLRRHAEHRKVGCIRTWLYTSWRATSPCSKL